MKPSHLHIDPKLIRELQKKYFNDPSKVVSLRKGEFLMHQNMPNNRLYLLLKGELAGYLDTGSGSSQETFHTEENQFVGVHSFFSEDFSAYADVVALKPCKLAYIDREDFKEDELESNLKDFVPVIVHELSARQVYARDLMQEKEAAMKKLYESDKLATLGQMAAGLAHELNNAIGVMNGNSEWLAGEVFKYFKNTEIDRVFSNFEKGFTDGQMLSSMEVRKERKQLEKNLKLPVSAAKKLAKIGIGEKDIRDFLELEEFEEMIDRMYYFWEMGVAIHDILLATRHAVHVLNSIKQLSVSDQAREEIELDDTFSEALVLLKTALRQVELNRKTTEGISIIANKGELVQIWVNIIKNACESMLQSGTKNPSLIVESTRKRGYAWVRITDNGPGIPADLQEKIFRPNFTTKKGGLSFGLGLGLSVVQRLVDSYNGKIEVFSKKGKTSFIIKLPN